MNGCTHARQVTYQRRCSVTDELVDYPVNESACVDISLHSYQCTLCGEVFWYSQRGRIAETRGIDVFDVTAAMVAEDDAR